MSYHRRNRDINIFNLSMLDVISSAMAAFLIIMIVLMPYYRKEHIDYMAMIHALREQLVDAITRRDAAETAAAEARSRADAAETAAAEARARADAAETATAEARARAAAAETAAAEARAQAERAEAMIQALKPRLLDLMIVLDTTGSMGPQIRGLQQDFRGLVRALKLLSSDLRVGLVAYRDRGSGEEYLTRLFPLTRMDTGGFANLQEFINRLTAGGGGADAPEAIDAGLKVALEQAWRSDSDGAIVVVADAPVHEAQRSLTLNQARTFSARSPTHRLSVLGVQRYRDYFQELANHGSGFFSPDMDVWALLETIIKSMRDD